MRVKKLSALFAAAIFALAFAACASSTPTTAPLVESPAVPGADATLAPLVDESPAA